MMKTKTKISDYTISKRLIEVNDLSFLSDRDHRYGWIRRHYKHHRLRRALKKQRTVIASKLRTISDVSISFPKRESLSDKTKSSYTYPYFRCQNLS